MRMNTKLRQIQRQSGSSPWWSRFHEGGHTWLLWLLQMWVLGYPQSRIQVVNSMLQMGYSVLVLQFRNYSRVLTSPSFWLLWSRQDWEFCMSGKKERLPQEAVDHKKKTLLVFVPSRTLKTQIQDFYLSLRKGQRRAFPHDYWSWELFSSKCSYRGNELALYLFLGIELFMIESHLQRRW